MTSEVKGQMTTGSKVIYCQISAITPKVSKSHPLTVGSDQHGSNDLGAKGQMTTGVKRSNIAKLV